MVDPGEAYWSFQTGGLVYSGPTVVDGTVYVGSEDRHMYALDAETGEEHWRFQVDPNPELGGAGGHKGNGIYTAPQVADGRVFFGANDYDIYGLDADTGDEEWVVETGSFVYGSPTYHDGTLYASARDASMYAIDGETGDVLWTADIGISGVAPLVHDGQVYTGSYSEGYSATCIDAETGAIEWQRGGIPTCSSPTIANDTVVMGALNRNVYGLDPGTGDTRWAVELEGMQDAASPTVKDGMAYISQFGGNLAAIDVEAGEKAWVAEGTYSGGHQSPTVVGDHVVYVNQDSIVNVVDGETGEVVFQDNVHDTSETAHVSPPIVVDGVLFVGAVNDRSVHAIELPIDGTSDGTRVEHGMMNHHHEWVDDDPQRLDVQATGVVDSGVEDVTSYRRHGGEGPYDGWMQDVANYDDETVDMRGHDEVTVLVGAGQNGFLFEPCAVLVDEATTVTWEWTGKGGAHNVQTLGGIEISEIAEDEGHTASKTMDIDWGSTMPYYCLPHESNGMKGVVAVGETDDSLVSPQ